MDGHHNLKRDILYSRKGAVLMRQYLKYPQEMQDKMLYMKSEGHRHKVIAEEMGLTVNQVRCFFDNRYRALQKKDPVKCPKRKVGRQARPEPTRKELEKEIKDLKKEIKLYQDFLHAAGRR
jgi:hypothetical protein